MEHSVAGNGAEYGVLESRNIDTVVLGDQKFDTWYGNSAYFQNLGDSRLGIDLDSTNSRRKNVLHVHTGFWIELLLVCEFCFRYSTDSEAMRVHRSMCSMATPFPPVGKLLYCDMKTPYVIKKVRGFRHPLFCQNLSLFSKLFLNDKSVFYSVNAFDYYIIYGYDAPPGTASNDPSQYFKPMGFFSKEVNSWESDNNLACICIFPPYQRLNLGSLLIDFSYALARLTPSQTLLGPEFPLSPYGQIVYLRYWSKRLAFTIQNAFAKDVKQVKRQTRGGKKEPERLFSLQDLAVSTGFRKDDILMTLEYMGVLRCVPDSDKVVFSTESLLRWCEANKVNPSVLSSLFNPSDALL